MRQCSRELLHRHITLHVYHRNITKTPRNRHGDCKRNSCSFISLLLEVEKGTTFRVTPLLIAGCRSQGKQTRLIGRSLSETFHRLSS